MRNKCQVLLCYMSEGGSGLLLKDNSIFLKETGISLFCTLLSQFSLPREPLRCLGISEQRLWEGKSLVPSDLKSKQRKSTLHPRCLLFCLPPPSHASVSVLCHIPRFSSFLSTRVIPPIIALPHHFHPQSCFVSESLHLCLAALQRTQSLRTECQEVSSHERNWVPLMPV